MRLELSRIPMILAAFLLLAIASYLFVLNVFVIPSRVRFPIGDVSWCRPKVLDDGLLIISGNTSIGDAVLCYKFQIPKRWDSVPASVMTMRLGIASYRAPWYIRGYSVEVSRYRVQHDLGIELPTRVEFIGGRDSDGREAYYFALALIDGEACKSYRTSLHISIRIRVTEWSILGPIRTFEIEILNKTIPLTIEIKHVETTVLSIAQKP